MTLEGSEAQINWRGAVSFDIKIPNLEIQSSES